MMLNSALGTSGSSDLDNQKKHARDRRKRCLANPAAPTRSRRRSQAGVQSDRKQPLVQNIKLNARLLLRRALLVLSFIVDRAMTPSTPARLGVVTLKMATPPLHRAKLGCALRGSYLAVR